MGKKFARLTFQVKSPSWRDPKEGYELRKVYKEFDENDDNCLTSLYSTACDLGADPNKDIRWKVMSELECVMEIFGDIKKDIPNLCRKWGKFKSGQHLFGDVLDWIRDNYVDIYVSPPTREVLARMIIGESVIQQKLL